MRWEKTRVGWHASKAQQEVGTRADETSWSRTSPWKRAGAELAVGSLVWTKRWTGLRKDRAIVRYTNVQRTCQAVESEKEAKHADKAKAI